MLRVFKASGEEALAIAATDMEEQPVRVLAIKRRLHCLTGQPRFKQRLVLSDGQMQADDVVLAFAEAAKSGLGRCISVGCSASRL